MATDAGLVITPIFDRTITTDANASPIENVINSAIAFNESAFADPIRVTITFSKMTSMPGSFDASTDAFLEVENCPFNRNGEWQRPRQ